MSKTRKWVDYDRASHGNPFDFILNEAARRRTVLEGETETYAASRFAARHQELTRLRAMDARLFE